MSTTKTLAVTVAGKTFDVEARWNSAKKEYRFDLAVQFDATGDLVNVRDTWASSEQCATFDGEIMRPVRGNLLLSESTTPAGTTAPAASLLAQRTNAFMGRIRP